MSRFSLEQQTVPRALGEIRAADGYIFRGYKIEYTQSGDARRREVWLSPVTAEKEKIRKAQWHIKNRERKQEMDRIYRSKPYNKKKLQQYAKEYRAVKGEDLLKKKREYRKRHKEKCAKAVSAWVKENRGRANFLRSQYRARKKMASVPLAEQQSRIVTTIYDTALRITKCIGIKMHVDHVRPLSLGGLHIPSNLQILPARLNHSKHARTGTNLEAWGLN